MNKYSCWIDREWIGNVTAESAAEALAKAQLDCPEINRVELVSEVGNGEGR